jgi:hypothetical protein
VDIPEALSLAPASGALDGDPPSGSWAEAAEPNQRMLPSTLRAAMHRIPSLKAGHSAVRKLGANLAALTAAVEWACSMTVL